MTQDDLENFKKLWDSLHTFHGGEPMKMAHIEFAKMVAAKEREACAIVCDGVYYQNIGPEFGEVRHGIAACAKAIRARGQQ